MQVQAMPKGKPFKCLALALSIVFLLACTSFAAHVDKAGGDDGKGHCSICLGATAHIVQPTAAIEIQPQVFTAWIASAADPSIKQDRFASSLYIRPPPSL
jgi:hypothetical protein